MTPHIEAKKGEIAKVCILAGDPLRAKRIAETYLENPKLVNSVRNMLFYTGEYQGMTLTVGSHGMGVPSMGIYSYELYKFYDVDYIIRVGSAGAYNKDLKLFDIFQVEETHGENDFFKESGGANTRDVRPSKDLYELINQVAIDNKVDLKHGKAHCSDIFYNPESFDALKFAKDRNLDVVEMETYALFSNAILLNKKAACLLTISDSFTSDEIATPQQRQNGFDNMCELALKTALKINETL
ncbi:purine-nucleoside phosphorylase [Mesoplasma lactucae]|uniref:Uridine phosphorylase n=1 Tax=Mesoplasma lactucae ATCC 49193 TaxID=81460 RepID=A0A291IR58_9MOLU|nr:purine-nucleoside phosphorylase [Mesoplasma lactucae]ATG97224.1 purine-nucleoside phosphorylase [Mesoplasma lactucae ATCC 49193]ATZ20334.1 purine nucleoside phosphorylase [Mesoplasma lactucae ATCC 49193]MCL8216505.1 Purine nucleoside phosphorylase DeoD-type [Mesoplasma lactucae ATCC 49193]